MPVFTYLLFNIYVRRYFDSEELKSLLSTLWMK